MKTNSFILLLAVVAGTAACKTGPSPRRPVTVQIPRFNGKPIKADIRNTNELSVQKWITVKVGGEVFRPNTYQLPEGTTVLGAIKSAGGFTSFAFAKKIRVAQGGKNYALRLQRETYGWKRRERVWYPDVHSSKNDFGLEDGATITVDRSLY